MQDSKNTQTNYEFFILLIMQNHVSRAYRNSTPTTFFIPIEYILKQWLNSEPPGCVHYRLYSFVKGYSVSYALIFNCVNTWPLRTHQSTIIFGHVPYLIENIAGGTFQKAIYNVSSSIDITTKPHF